MISGAISNAWREIDDPMRDDDYEPVKVPKPCRAFPGTRARIASLRKRVSRGELLWNDEDVRFPYTETAISDVDPAGVAVPAELRKARYTRYDRLLDSIIDAELAADLATKHYDA